MHYKLKKGPEKKKIKKKQKTDTTAIMLKPPK